jgi:ABC-type nitrate/sulfonate/bicarbonate transport system substrate-binding protein
MRSAARSLIALSALAVLLAACGDDDGAAAPDTTAATTTAAADTTAGGDTTAAGTSAATTTVADDGLVGTVTSEGISADRCAANEAAGTIRYLSGFDFAATASIVNVVMAEKQGYFDELCLDVELVSSFSTANYPLVAANEAQFASGGSFSEVVDFSSRNDDRLVVVSVEGRTGIDALLVNPDAGVTSLEDLRGKTIGVKGKITPSVKAMLAEAGLVEGEDYQTVLLDGFDPKAHIQQPVAGFPVYKSNEPNQLERAGIPFLLFDPADDGIPGSFGILYTNREFLDEHPTAVQDFLRASMKGLEDAIADPAAAVAESLRLITEGGNRNFLSEEGETERWQVDAELLASKRADGPLGTFDAAAMAEEVRVLTEAGVFETAPDLEGAYDDVLVAGVYGPDGVVVFPGS